MNALMRLDCKERLRHIATRLHLRREPALRHRRHLGPGSPEAQRMRDAVALNEAVEQIYRQQMRRRNPGATEEEIEAMVKAWQTGPDRGERPEGGPR